MKGNNNSDDDNELVSHKTEKNCVDPWKKFTISINKVRHS